LSATEEITERNVQQDRCNQRRERNRHAAARCRKRRIEHISALEGQVVQLSKENDLLKKDNAVILDEINRVRAQLLSFPETHIDPPHSMPFTHQTDTSNFYP